ncbi:glycosyltransferase family 2 protein [Pandoraea apista]|uniref:glycosyltransferase family 2 protein n=1 Tax=Pandoraea apista TaxID=93218 RepID=UPI00248EA43D|nr:glycosyltransferase family 2 protein [Pandoraea apista]
MLKISVVTATYNCERTILSTLESIRNQTYAAVEHVIMDGASKDRTLEVIGHHKTRDTKVISEADNGIYDALNKGIRATSGDVIGLLHADDVFNSPDTLARVAEAFADASIEAVYGDLVYVDAKDMGKVIRYWKAGQITPGKFRRGWMPPHPTVFVRSSVYRRLGVFDQQYKIAADYDLMLRFLFAGSVKAAYLPIVITRMRVGGASNRSLKNIILKMREDYRVVRSNEVGGLMVLMYKNLTKIPQFWRRER